MGQVGPLAPFSHQTHQGTHGLGAELKSSQLPSGKREQQTTKKN